MKVIARLYSHNFFNRLNFLGRSTIYLQVIRRRSPVYRKHEAFSVSYITSWILLPFYHCFQYSYTIGIIFHSCIDVHFFLHYIFNHCMCMPAPINDNSIISLNWVKLHQTAFTPLDNSATARNCLFLKSAHARNISWYMILQYVLLCICYLCGLA